jgi:sulfite reductase alpha subunit-like flavoprotein
MDPEDNKHNWPQATVTAHDALQKYIEISEQTRRALLSFGGTTSIDEPHLGRCRALLKELKEKQVDRYVNDNRGPPEELPR